MTVVNNVKQCTEKNLEILLIPRQSTINRISFYYIDDGDEGVFLQLR
jgi:hypothetical protein